MAGFFVSNVEGFTGCVGNRIILPWGQAKFVRVFKPGVSTTTFRDYRSEVRVSQHIYPWSRCYASRLGGDYIFAPVRRESAKAVVEHQIGSRLCRKYSFVATTSAGN